MMDDAQPYVEARSEDDESDVRYFEIDADSWVRKEAMLPFIRHESVVQLDDNFLLVKHIHDKLGHIDHSRATFRLLERGEAARWYLMNGFEFPEGLAKLVDNRIILLEMAQTDETIAVKARFKPPPCKKCGGKSKVYRTATKIRYIMCQICNHTWKSGA
jgi:hypothetical protein